MNTKIILLIVIVSVLVLSMDNNVTEGMAQRYYCDPAHPRSKDGKGGTVGARCRLYDKTVDKRYIVYKSLDKCEKMCNKNNPSPHTHPLPKNNDQGYYNAPLVKHHPSPNKPNHNISTSGTQMKMDDLGNITFICANTYKDGNQHPPGHNKNPRHYLESNSTDDYDPIDVAPSNCGGPYF